MAWTVPEAWPGAVVAILATGPSLPGAIDSVKRAHEAGHCRAIAVNDAYLLAPWADALYSADAVWWHHHLQTRAEEMRAFRGLRVTVSPGVPGSHVLEVGDRVGFDTRKTHLASGGNSGYQAAHLAVHLGARRVVLFGLDMHTERGAHYFGEHPAPLRNTPNYKTMLRRFETLGPGIKKAGIRCRIVNGTPGSALRCYPFVRPDGAWWA